jgi:hypothetical protein
MSATKAKILSVLLPAAIMRGLPTSLTTSWLAPPPHALGSEKGDCKLGDEKREQEHQIVTLCYILSTSIDSYRTIGIAAKVDLKHYSYSGPCKQECGNKYDCEHECHKAFFRLENGKRSDNDS